MNAGIKELLDLKTFLVAIYDGVQNARKDGKIDASDFSFFVPALMALPAALGDVTDVGNEVRDLDEAELTQLLGDLEAALGITNASAVIYFHEGFQILKSLWNIVKAARGQAA